MNGVIICGDSWSDGWITSKQIVHRVKGGYLSGRTRPSAYRVQQLRALKRLITDNQDDLCRALWHDLHKVLVATVANWNTAQPELWSQLLCFFCVPLILLQPQQEVVMTELNLIMSDISLAISSVEKWMAPQYVSKDLVNRFNTAFIQPEPYGVVLIISPWNYPLMLSLQPLVGVIAAGSHSHFVP